MFFVQIIDIQENKFKFTIFLTDLLHQDDLNIKILLKSKYVLLTECKYII